LEELWRDWNWTELFVVGLRPPASVKLLDELAGVNVIGPVDEVEPHYQSAMVSICPLLSGGGTRTKILESLSYGVPVVSTSLGAEGLDAEHEKHIAIADEPKQFAKRIVELCSVAELWDARRQQGYKFVESNYSDASLLRIYETLFRDEN